VPNQTINKSNLKFKKFKKLLDLVYKQALNVSNFFYLSSFAINYKVVVDQGVVHVSILLGKRSYLPLTNVIILV
jgi:hypothetical protein